MSRRMVVTPLIVIAVSLSSLVLAAQGPVLYEGTLEPDQFAWTELADGSYRLDLGGGRSLGVTDLADLPAIDLLLLVPADLAIAGVEVEPLAIRSIVAPGRLALAGALASSAGDLLPQRDLEPAGGMFPPSWGAFGGVHSWRGYRLLAVTVHPARLRDGDPGSPARLDVLERFAIRAVSTGAPAASPPLARERLVAGERSRLERLLRPLVANPEAVTSYQREDGAALDKSGAPFLPTPNPSLEGSGIRYLIVTSAALAPEFQRLADHRTRQGLPALVVTREWISANFRRGVDFQETLRMFLQDAYAKWGVEYLLLGGDTEIVPTRTIRSNFYPYGGHTDIPTDTYYAALDGNWGADGDGWLGEPYVTEGNPGDNADLAPELAVARAPVRSLLGAQQFVDKVLGYEATPAGALWANRILFAAEVLFPSPWHPGEPITLDGAQYAQTLIDTIIESCSTMSYVRMYETAQLYPRDAPLTRAALIDSLNTGHYGHVDQFGHGHYFNMSVGDANFTVSDADALHNPHHFLLFAVNCASGAFDFSCLMERFVENPDGGAIVSVSAAREAFPSNSFGYQSTFYGAMVCDGVLRVPDAFNVARLQYIGIASTNTADRWTQLNAAIIGDPATGIWCGPPLAPSITAPANLAVGEQTVQVQVVAGGRPAVGADVCLVKDGETYAWAVTDPAGQASLTIVPQTAGTVTLTVSGANLVRTTRTIPVAGSATYVAMTGFGIGDQSPNGNGNGVAEAGETISLALQLQDLGGGGATGLNVTLTSDDPQLVVLDGTASAGNIAPGGSTTNLDPLVVKPQTIMRDGLRIAMRIVVTANGGGSWVSNGLLEVRVPEPEVARLVVDDSVYGDGDGVAESNERLVLRPYVKNYGSGRLDQLVAQVTNAAAGVTVHSAFAFYANVDLLEEETYQSGELSVTLANIGQLQPCRVDFQDNYGRTFTQPLEFNEPAAPGLPAADATIASDAIALRWDPVGGAATLGYHVYRAAAEAGPFSRANPDLLQGIAYFEDRGLMQLTPYWYKVTAVDTFLQESDFSPVVTQGTMPPELTNFPLEFQLQTSGHIAVGDIDGDGRLEIVLASDEVYAWNEDGSELVDGDNDAQTTGPLTGVDGQFEPSGVVLADLDGEPGLEIIASERLNARQIHVFRADGSELPGWPRTMQNSWNWATPAVGDVDGDGDNEVVVNDTAGRTFVWHHTGVELRDGDSNPATNGVFVDRDESWGYSSPALFDLDGDGACEIIFGTRYFTPGNALLAYRYNGSQAQNFPFTTGSAQIICAPAIADLDRDGDKEIVFFTTAHYLYAIHHNAAAYPGFPVFFNTNWDDSPGPSPAVGNFDGDNDLEILWPVNGGSFRLDLIAVDTGRFDGTTGDIMAGWPVQLPANSEGSPVVGDINGDGLSDVVQPVGSDETETPDLIFAVDHAGEGIPGFPIRLDGIPRSTPVICDLDLDGDVEVVYGSWDRLLHAWDLPAPFDAANVPWPTFHGNPQRTGVAVQVSITGVDDPVVPSIFTVMPPHPNPFNPVTTLRLYVAPGPDRRLDVAVYDLRGRRIRQLHAGDAAAGWHDLTWDGRDDTGRGQASGVYFVRAQQAAESRTFKLTLVK
ncbi:MAG TPA: C25 family cysteine peptidase [Candidatus Krumholzibacteria bacterium]|nr:C25 family cysteine peptidase [Candidatus Krumholzibacteria bacterium]HPD71744.1 C25 family cysteine peptidase [Candidatus Krumholzibacteria bacterium]